MSARTADWSKPYCDVQHLDNVRRPFQVTVTHYGRFSEVQIFDASKPFSGMNVEHTIFKVGAPDVEPGWAQHDDPPEAARAWAVEKARALGLIS